MNARTRPFKASPVPDQQATNATEAQRLGGNSRRQKKDRKSGSQCTGHEGLIIGNGLVAAFDYGMRACTAQNLIDRDTAHRFGKHLLGAVLMGVGGVLAGGCTVGQGLTAGSLLAVSWLITVPGIICGAYVGLTILVEGSIKEALSNRIRSRSWQP